MEKFVIVNLLTSILGREYCIVKCLPIILQEYMYQLENNVIFVYNNMCGKPYNFDNKKEYYDFLDVVSLY